MPQINVSIDTDAKTMSVTKDGTEVPFTDMSLSSYRYCDCMGVWERRMCLYFSDIEADGTRVSRSLEIRMDDAGKVYASQLSDISHQDLENIHASLRRTVASNILAKELDRRRKG